MTSALGGGRGNQKADVSTDKLLESDSDKGRGKKNLEILLTTFKYGPSTILSTDHEIDNNFLLDQWVAFSSHNISEQNRCGGIESV